MRVKPEAKLDIGRLNERVFSFLKVIFVAVETEGKQLTGRKFRS